ncbi:MAG: ornithine cyclodeaminase family protein [Bryobacteraceae bacterium]|nr:ornithine cyclodeaminase family protein [Bryobacteraceae bacterium]
MLFLTEAEVQELLPIAECIEQMRSAFRALGEGAALNQPRRRLAMPGGSVLHQMAASYRGYFGTKFYSTNPRHGAHFLFVLYEEETARPLALMEADYLGQIRTGAASGLATDLLAPQSASVLAVIGSGFQAKSQVEAVCAVRPIREVRVWSRTQTKRDAFARAMEERIGRPVRALDSAQAAVADADIVATATYSREPVLDASWVKSGAHLNVVGSNQANRREVPTELVRRAACLAVDSVEQARMEAGDLVLALEEAEWEKVKPLSDLVRGPVTGQGMSLFKSVGLAVEDVAAAASVYEKAMKQEKGIDLPILYS